MEEEKEFKRRAVAIEKYIKEIDASKDIRVKIVGTVVNKNEATKTFVLDDGESQVNVLVLDNDVFKNVEVGKLVRVIGIVLPSLEEKGEKSKDEFEIKCEFIQDFSKLDMEIFKKYMTLRENL
ncbi:MAG: hypothetical protein OH319_04400 [Candidatus Parvarchaeota archaeon]|nr:hypothetical protein [Candidatus Jingweiarchaeum tengchongense]MCW1297923.1 hypothetical protein [Candidatus Jingweiarchaeum tengchongense]MCW1300642.1 hypothetical protein [Candidatus Jingweiarchaeum tengchongense]MCW1304639.1 hypothetical protein [Candidatus Jingweiarchaeum tengchongense]MCW1305656.1 hypothetical protein [Candidatus Jingweiarchaeum tengchongense]